MKRREERGGDTFSCHFGRTVHWGLGPSGHLIRLLSQPEHLPAIWHFHPPDRATHLLEARGAVGVPNTCRLECNLPGAKGCKAAFCVPGNASETSL